VQEGCQWRRVEEAQRRHDVSPAPPPSLPLRQRCRASFHAADEAALRHANRIREASGAPSASLCSEDGLGALDTVLGRAGSKKAFGTRGWGGETSGAPQISLGDALRDATRDALYCIRYEIRTCIHLSCFRFKWLLQCFSHNIRILPPSTNKCISSFKFCPQKSAFFVFNALLSSKNCFSLITQESPVTFLIFLHATSSLKAEKLKRRETVGNIIVIQKA
jgi:hypothetical protein